MVSWLLRAAIQRREYERDTLLREIVRAWQRVHYCMICGNPLRTDNHSGRCYRCTWHKRSMSTCPVCGRYVDNRAKYCSEHAGPARQAGRVGRSVQLVPPTTGNG